MLLLILMIVSDMIYLTELSEYQYLPEKSLNVSYDVDNEVVIPDSIENFEEMPVALESKFSCGEFESFKENITLTSVAMYNSSTRSPPLPSKMPDWCRSLKHVTNRAIDWNSECKETSAEHFNMETIKGHLHVIAHVCDDATFIVLYYALTNCLAVSSLEWEACYVDFKEVVDVQKNKTLEWTHFETHFYMCCAKALFRRCTLETVYRHRKICSHDQALTLQKFSVILSEGEVFQNCDVNVEYSQCPNGDPRPNGKMLYRIVSPTEFNGASQATQKIWIVLFLIVIQCCGNIHF